MQKRDENQTFLGKSSVDSLPIHKYLFGETVLDVRAFYAEGEDTEMYQLRRRLSEGHDSTAGRMIPILTIPMLLLHCSETTLDVGRNKPVFSDSS